MAPAGVALSRHMSNRTNFNGCEDVCQKAVQFMHLSRVI